MMNLRNIELSAVLSRWTTAIKPIVSTDNGGVCISNRTADRNNLRY